MQQFVLSFVSFLSCWVPTRAYFLSFDNLLLYPTIALMKQMGDMGGMDGDAPLGGEGDDDDDLDDLPDLEES